MITNREKKYDLNYREIQDLTAMQVSELLRSLVTLLYTTVSVECYAFSFMTCVKHFSLKHRYTTRRQTITTQSKLFKSGVEKTLYFV